jgi:hypothetical protein
MQDLVDPHYASSEEGYEGQVVQNLNKEVAKKIAANAYVPVVVNDPYSIPAQAYAAPAVPVINNNAYGSLSASGGAGVIQSGVFMNNQPVGNTYQQPYYGGGYPPAQQ